MHVSNYTYSLGKDIKICLDSEKTIGTSQNFDSYTWSTGEKTRKIKVNKSGEYWACVKSKSCTYCDTINVYKYIPHIKVESLSRAFKLNVTGGVPPYKFSIDGKNYTSQPHFKNLDMGRYRFFVKDNLDCSATTSYYDAKDLIIPNFFSPNGDGINDMFIIDGINNYPKSVIEIYDRYGKMLIRYNGSDLGWNGRDSKGNDLIQDDYWYLIKLPNSKVYKGNVSLVK